MILIGRKRSNAVPGASNLGADMAAVQWRANAQLIVLAALLGGILGCDRPSSQHATDSTLPVADSVKSPSSAQQLSAQRPFGSGWDASTGMILVLPTPDGGMLSGSLLRPEATELTVSDTAGVGNDMGDGHLDLFSRSGRVGGAVLTVRPAMNQAPECSVWPVAQLRLDDGTVVAPWTAAFLAGRVIPIPLDSIEGLSARDSSMLAANLTRLASRLPDDTSVTFRLLPSVVWRAWRSTGLDTGFVVATLVRRLNQEDDPREERVVMVVNTPSSDPRTWSVAWHERASGREEELVVAEPLLGYRVASPVGSSEVNLLVGRDDGVALSAAVLRRKDGSWTILWESAIAGCN